MMSQQANESTSVFRKISPYLVLLALYGVFFLPFWKPLLLAFIFACAFAPVVSYLEDRLHSSKKWTPFLVTATLLALFLTFSIAAGLKIYSSIYAQVQDSSNLLGRFERLVSVKNQVVHWIQLVPFFGSQNIEMQMDRLLTDLTEQAKQFSLQVTKTFIVETPDILMNFFIFLISFSVLLAWGKKKWSFLSSYFSVFRNTSPEVFNRFENVCTISIGSILLTGLIQAAVVALGAALTDYPIFLCFLSAFALSLIPMVGAASVPVILSLLSFSEGANSPGVILLITSLIAGTSDNVVRAWLFSKAANTNPVVSLLALLGGISLFGFTGLFLAPIVEQLTMSYLQGGHRNPQN